MTPPGERTAMFAGIHRDYDRFNRLLSLGQDQSWRRALAKAVHLHGARTVLDLAAGTGDITLLLQAAGIEVTAADPCEPMLQQARDKGVRQTIQCPAEQLPFEDASYDAVTIGWGYRNFADRAQALHEIRRVLKPGGWLFILECSQPPRVLRPFHRFYMGILSPGIVGLGGGKASAYRYLASSTAAFPDAPTLGSHLEKAGFSHVSWKSFALGAIALHSAQKCGR